MGDDFAGEFRVNVKGEFGPFETTAPERWYDSSARTLSAINSATVDKAVETAPQTFKNADLAKLPPNERLMLGHALVLGGHLDDAWTVLAGAAEEASKDNADFAQWIWCSAAWAAWLGHDEAKLKQATDKVFSVVAADRAKRDAWNVRHWFAAWLLGEATDDELVANCTREPWNCGAPFFVAERLLRDGKLNEAKAAYEHCVKLCGAGGQWPLGWAVWRFKQIGASRSQRAQ